MTSRTAATDDFWFAPDEEVTNGTASFVRTSESFERLLWTDCRISQSRLTASTFTGCQFERVTFEDCDLSSVSFIDCVFKECEIRGGKRAPFLAWVDSLINGLDLVGISADTLEMQSCRLRKLNISGCSLARLTFSAARRTPRQQQSVMIEDTTLDAVGGISQLAEAGVEIRIDATLWALFGDLVLRQMGIRQVDDPPVT